MNDLAMATSNFPILKDCMRPPVAVLVSTLGQRRTLESRVFPAILNQSIKPEVVLVVVDASKSDSYLERVQLWAQNFSSSVPIRCISSDRTPGLGGTLNAGLEVLWKASFRGYVALLDDDDSWDPEHLEVNATLAASTGCGIVISGLRFLKGGKIVPRPLIRKLRDRDFLIGNPGWQGSNTFAHIKLLKDVGGFRETLPSCHDRDLAIRLLRHPRTKIAYSAKWTATWHFGDQAGFLSCPGSLRKASGLREFWRIYGSEMKPAVRKSFFTRAEEKFGISESVITQIEKDQPLRLKARGDW